MISRRRMTPDEARKESRFIWTMLAVIAVVIAVALYYWLYVG